MRLRIFVPIVGYVSSFTLRVSTVKDILTVRFLDLSSERRKNAINPLRVFFFFFSFPTISVNKIKNHASFERIIFRYANVLIYFRKEQ